MSSIIATKILEKKNNNAIAQLEEIPRFQLRNRHADKCLDDTGIKKIGQGYHLWDCADWNANQWFSTKIQSRSHIDGYVNIVGPTGLCISAKNIGGRLVQEKCGESDDLLWTSAYSKIYKYGILISKRDNKVRRFYNKNGTQMDISEQSSLRPENGRPILAVKNKHDHSWPSSTKKNILTKSEFWYIEKKAENCKLKFYDNDYWHSVHNRDYSCGIGKRANTCTRTINLEEKKNGDGDLIDDIWKIDNNSTNCTCIFTFTSPGSQTGFDRVMMDLYNRSVTSNVHFSLEPLKSKITKHIYANKVIFDCRRTKE